MPERTIEQQTIIDQLKQVAKGLGETFAPFCEVVVHDLADAEHAIVAIHNNLSGRNEGEPATELGLARIADNEYPQVLSNYANQFSDGRRVKSTSIGIKDSRGGYVAALCINIDLTLFGALQSALGRFASTDEAVDAQESLEPSGAAIRRRIDEFAARLGTMPRALKAEDRRALIHELKQSGCMEVRRAIEIAALHLGVSRATIYNYAK
ncbi:MULTISPECIES: helix-turn-helix transcriptional regulator [Paraburkholderia]|uniref:helix-turn-helix transcriptional regulator n=1 Tax=Paraburkholderia TaxID=1822464 RepID=UPI000375F6E0|nr:MULTISPECIES: PAS domain-containing protein [Paraburkholderia]MDH6147474.1 putative transcriptional regulator YheO [Paraburkholderia sp. WSM4179]